MDTTFVSISHGREILEKWKTSGNNPKEFETILDLMISEYHRDLFYSQIDRGASSNDSVETFLKTMSLESKYSQLVHLIIYIKYSHVINRYDTIPLFCGTELYTRYIKFGGGN